MVCERSWVRVPDGKWAYSSAVMLWLLSVNPYSDCEQQRFRADSVTNLIKHGEIVKGRPCGSVAQWPECLHGMQETLGPSSGRTMCLFLPCDTLGEGGGARRWKFAENLSV